MYSGNGTYYTEEHSVSFGNLYVPSGQTYTDFQTTANTWTSWYLIPSSRPVIAPPPVVTKYVEIPGSDGSIDLSDYLIGRPTYGQRTGSLSFEVANGFEYWETIRASMAQFLHGKTLKMRLEDDPEYYYEGRFTLGPWQSGASNSSITLSYNLNPYKLKINTEGTTPILWDPFNFETDYDYYTTLPGGSSAATNNVTAGTYCIYAGDYAFSPIVTWVSGSGTVTFNGATFNMSSAGYVTLPSVEPGENTLVITGTLSVHITWRGGLL